METFKGLEQKENELNDILANALKQIPDDDRHAYFFFRVVELENKKSFTLHTIGGSHDLLGASLSKAMVENADLYSTIFASVAVVLRNNPTLYEDFQKVLKVKL